MESQRKCPQWVQQSTLGSGMHLRLSLQGKRQEDQLRSLAQDVACMLRRRDAMRVSNGYDALVRVVHRGRQLWQKRWVMAGPVASLLMITQH